MTESAALNELIRCGYSPSIPFGDNDKYDLLVDAGDRIYRVQCKTAREYTPGLIVFNTHSQTTKDGEYYQATYDEGIDAFMVRFPGEESFHWIPIEGARDHRMRLRYDAQIDHPSINWAEKNVLEDGIPE